MNIIFQFCIVKNYKEKAQKFRERLEEVVCSVDIKMIQIRPWRRVGIVSAPVWKDLKCSKTGLYPLKSVNLRGGNGFTFTHGKCNILQIYYGTHFRKLHSISCLLLEINFPKYIFIFRKLGFIIYNNNGSCLNQVLQKCLKSKLKCLIKLVQMD